MILKSSLVFSQNRIINSIVYSNSCKNDGNLIFNLFKKIAKLKIQHNPFAKGFREGHNRKRAGDNTFDNVNEQRFKADVEINSNHSQF